jgi:DNA-binding transcriptional regulator YiaG
VTSIVDVKALRERLGWSRETLANRWGITPFEVSFFERRGYLSDAMAQRLAQVVSTTRRRAPMTASRLKFWSEPQMEPDEATKSQ